MEKIFSELKIKIDEKLKSMEIIVDDIYYEEKDNNNFLVVVLDKLGGIDLDTIVIASKIVDKVIEKYDLPYKNYILDIVSKERG